MSLKAIHICFIVLAILLALGFGVWGIRDYSVSKNLVNLWMGIGSFVGGGVLVGYLFWFIYKMRRIDSL